MNLTKWHNELTSIKEYLEREAVDASQLERTIWSFPEGWSPLINQVFWFWAAYRSPAENKQVKIAKGLLRFSCTFVDERDQIIFDRISESIASSSSRLCMMCGKYGVRRKKEDGWPCVCTTHYIEFLEQLYPR